MDLLWIILAAIGVIIFLLFTLIVFVGAPYVPSHPRYARQALTKLYPVGKQDVLLDVGSGDGIILRMASRRGARAVGYELNPILVAISRWVSRGDSRVTVRLADFWTTPFPDDLTVIYVFAVDRDTKRLVKKIQTESARIGRQFSVVSYGAALPGIEPIKQLDAHRLYRI